MVLPWILLSFSISTLLIVVRNHHWRPKASVNIMLPIMFILYWIGVLLYDYDNWYNTPLCVLGAELVMVGYSLRYLIFFADRFDRFSGKYAGSPNDNGSFGFGKYIWVTFLIFTIGAANVLGFVQYVANTTYEQWEADGRNYTSPAYGEAVAYETFVMKGVEFELFIHIVSIIPCMPFMFRVLCSLYCCKTKPLDD